MEDPILWLDTRKGRDSPFSDFCWLQKSLCQWPFLARSTYRLFGSSFLVSLTELSSIDVKCITSFIKLSGWFSSVVKVVILMGSPCVDQLLPPSLFWQNLVSIKTVSQRAAMRAQVSLVISELPLRLKPKQGRYVCSSELFGIKATISTHDFGGKKWNYFIWNLLTQ